MQNVNFTITKDKNDTATYGVEAAFVELEANLGIFSQAFSKDLNSMISNIY
jgi:hypothetical protein